MSHQLRAVLAAPNTDVVDVILRDGGPAGDGLLRLAARFGSNLGAFAKQTIQTALN